MFTETENTPSILQRLNGHGYKYVSLSSMTLRSVQQQSFNIMNLIKFFHSHFSIAMYNTLFRYGQQCAALTSPILLPIV